jgi:predicted transcriptional regulator
MLDILRSGSTGAVKKTHMMYKTNLNFVSFNRIFPILLEQGLIVDAGDPEGGTLYRTSEKGMSLIKVLSEAETKIPKKDQPIRTVLPR